jgi:hypothetical protein
MRELTWLQTEKRFFPKIFPLLAGDVPTGVKGKRNKNSTKPKMMGLRFAMLFAVCYFLFLVGIDGRTISVQYYPQGNGDCLGPANTSTYALNKCYAGKGNSTESGFEYTDGALNATCFTIDLFPPKETGCDGQPNYIYTGPCGVCQHDGDPTVGRYIWKCDPEAEYALRHVGCNQDCSVCNITTPIGKTGCVAVGGSIGSLRLLKLYPCSYITSTEYIDGSCAVAKPRWRPVCGHCYTGDAVRYEC